MHPLVNDFSGLTDTEIENKIIDLQRKYFMSHNPEVQHQITLVLDSYKIELEQRQIAAKKAQQENNDSDLDNLINVS